MEIDQFRLRTIYDSRVNPTVEAEINGHRAAAPSGASTGSHEAKCFVPDDLSEREHEIQHSAYGKDLSQADFDTLLHKIDGSYTFSNIGAVAIASSLAFKKASGFDYGDTPRFPYPVGNLVGGGAHGGNTTIQEFLVIPTNADSIPEAMETLADIYHAFREKHKQRIKGINDEGAFVTNLNDEETLEAVKEIADEHSADVGIDAAATEFYDEESEQYEYPEMGLSLPPKQQVKFMKTFIDRFDLMYVEDPFHEEDFENTAELTSRVQDTLIVGDDLFVTNTDRLQQGVSIDAGNALIIKPNQVGTVTETQNTLELAHEHNYTPIVSHRSGETCDPAIADLAVEWGAPFIKAGIAGIRTAKNNQLLRLWDELDGEMAEWEL